ncbi:MAG: galactitol-phosphate 5-dehydrogenase [Actinoallomurus sp.]|jgi:2-desacetyl-2-hydroxyethyl bacteriochlorophyllide A dehydrogenase|nr:galactitol-phosphate 5-dehydrogenase [Actinoallomurus sp.]
MKALVYEAPEVMNIRLVEPPAPGPDEVLIRVAYSGICGSELSGFLGQNSLRTPPLVFGHELGGWIESAGEHVPVSTLEPGTPVTVNPLVTCGTCRYCVTGRQQLCGRRLLLGASLPGCNADFVAVPAASVLPLPATTALRDAAMTEPAACAIHAVETGGTGPDSIALVVGAGPIGLFLLQVLEQYGVTERYVAELNPARLAMARALGATPVGGDGDIAGDVLAATGGLGADVTFDAVGTAETRRACLSATAAGGRLLLVGLHSDETAFPVNSVIRSEVSLSGVFAYSPADFHTALDWLGSGRIGLRDGVVEVPLDEGAAWYARLVAGDGASKVLLKPDHPDATEAARQGAGR